MYTLLKAYIQGYRGEEEESRQFNLWLIETVIEAVLLAIFVASLIP